MRHILNPRLHGFIDYALVAVLAFAPSWLAFGGVPATFCYVFAALHLTLSLITDYPGGILRAVPFQAHGQLELIVGVLFLILPWFAAFGNDAKAEWFFIITGLMLLVIRLVTNYRSAQQETRYHNGPSIVH